MKEYQKIEAIFERDIAGRKKLIIGNSESSDYLANPNGYLKKLMGLIR